jgi:hypothetical protein
MKSRLRIIESSVGLDSHSTHWNLSRVRRVLLTVTSPDIISISLIAFSLGSSFSCQRLRAIDIGETVADLLAAFALSAATTFEPRLNVVQNVARFRNHLQ